MDNATKHMYEQISCKVPDSQTFLRLFLERDFGEGYELLIKLLRWAGNYSQRAETHLQLTFVDVIFGLPDNEMLQALYQVRHKKSSISINAIKSKDEDFQGAGDDIWVYRMVRYFHPHLHDVPRSQLKRFVRGYVRTLASDPSVTDGVPSGPAVGWWINEVAGTIGQLLSNNDLRPIAQSILLDVASQYGDDYDELIDQLVKIDGWVSLVRDNFVADTGPRRNRRRIIRGAEPEPVTSPPKKKRRAPAKKVKELESPEPEYKMSAYEKLVAEKKERNKARLRSLGF